MVTGLWRTGVVDSIPPMSETKRLILVGAFNFAEEITDLCQVAGIEVAAWIEGLDRARVDAAHDPPILWVDGQAAFEPDLPILPAIGSVARKGIVTRLVGEGRSLATLIHPTAVVAPSAIIEPGCVVFPLVVVAARARIGQGTVLNRASLVGHHTVVGPYSFLGPGANVCGLVTIGEQVYIGAGAIVRDRARVGDGATVGMGAVAVADVAPGTTVIGLPAHPVERPAKASS
jgi:sugar O-acyltransferase (sialic acid O-acetyltransferase NeuD family)